MSRRKIKFVGEKTNNKLAYLFIAPWLLGLLVFTLIPMCMTFAYSFANIRQTNFGFEYDFIGMSHYTTAFLGNLDFTEALLGFLAMEVTYVPIIIIISFIIALVLTKGIKGKTIFRVIFFLPVIIISGSLISRIFPEPFVTEAGTIIEETNALEESFIYLMISSYSKTAAEAIAYIYDQFVIILWFTGIPIILFINGLQKINYNLYEAAQLDGATSWQTLWKVTIPNVRGLAAIIAVFSIVQLSTMQVSDMYTLIGNQLSDTTGYGRTSAYALIYAIVIVILIAIAFLILNPKEKKAKEVIQKTQHEQLKITLKRMEEEKKHAKLLKKSSKKA